MIFSRKPLIAFLFEKIMKLTLVERNIFDEVFSRDLRKGTKLFRFSLPLGWGLPRDFL